MVDKRTSEWAREFLRNAEQRQHLNMTDKKTQEWTKEFLKTAEEICQCADCAQARMKKEISRCDKAALATASYMNVRSKIFRNPPGFIPELSPDPVFWT